MEQQHTDLELLRSQWQSLDLDVRRLTDTNRRLMQKLAAERACSKQQRLALQYRISGIVAVVLLPVLATMMYQTLGVSELTAWIYAVGGAAIGIMNICFSYFIGRTDYITRSTCEAIEHAGRVLIWQSRMRIAGYTVAAVVLAPLFYHLSGMDSKSALVGGAIGLVIGLAIGLIIEHHRRRTARMMLADLESEE
ncbi:MAG: DUF4231 domain-containing protein [Muribaculaceae bacterium]|nr:DUF4231 domain-containing protein [Muribaculaceae bacterium]MDE6540724.1 DUF4231 domain-containing protein [Muribaculaceae bacterium]